MSKTIGLIDDSKVMRSILRKSILMNHVQVTEFLEAGNGLEGFEMLSGHRDRLDIAFVDLHMPKMGGLEMLKRLRSAGIASLTAFQDFLPKDKQRAMEIVMEQKEQKKLKKEESGEGEIKDTNNLMR